MTEFIVMSPCYSASRTGKGQGSLFICCSVFSVLRISHYQSGQAGTGEYVLKKAGVNIKT